MGVYYGWIIVAAGALMECVAIGSVYSLAVFLRPHLRTSTEPEAIANTVVMLCDPHLSRRINGTLVEIYSNE